MSTGKSNAGREELTSLVQQDLNLSTKKKPNASLTRSFRPWKKPLSTTLPTTSSR
jgi:hypothetical protein